MIKSRPNVTRLRLGLSLVEILIAGSVAAVLLTAVATAFDATSRSVQVNDRFNRAAQIARIGVRRMVEDVRTAEACQVGEPSQQSQKSIVNASLLSVIRADGKLVRYEFDATNKVLNFVSGDPLAPTTVVLARNVEDARFSADIEPHPDTGIRRTVRVVIELRLNVGGQSLYLSGSAVPRREMVY
jgi:hypothetical protein